MIARLVLVAVVSYLLGCSNGAILVSKYILHDDIRQYGSGNAGLTNFLRVFGGKLTVLVILSDMLKAILAVILGALVLGALEPYHIPMFGRLWAAMFCMLGHDFPCMFGFKGGKGVLSGGAIVIAMTDWRLLLICWGAFMVLAVLTRYVSLGSICAGAAFVVGCWIFYPHPVSRILSLVCGGLVIWSHRANIGRLLHGKENKFSLHKKGDQKK
jgi:glycerol-3-phosphate acyltransferase PlsY